MFWVLFVILKRFVFLGVVEKSIFVRVVLFVFCVNYLVVVVIIKRFFVL